VCLDVDKAIEEELIYASGRFALVSRSGLAALPNAQS
jgi:hypothetical protein